MEAFINDFMSTHSHYVYLLVLVWTFFEGETVVLVLSALVAGGAYTLNLPLLGLCATLGSFGGDQLFFYLGRRFGTPLLTARPKLAAKADWAFTMVRRNETLFILSFRFIYGVRNVSPFVIAISGVRPMRFFFLNLIAAALWATSFVVGGFLLGRVLEVWLKEYKLHVLAAVLILIATVYLISRRKTPAPAAAQVDQL